MMKATWKGALYGCMGLQGESGIFHQELAAYLTARRAMTMSTPEQRLRELRGLAGCSTWCPYGPQTEDPYIPPQSSIVLSITTPKKGTPIFGQPYMLRGMRSV